MVEVCRYSETSSMNSSMSDLSGRMMKHPTSNIEVFEFNLGKAHELRCVNSDKSTLCGKCETCLLNKKLKSVKEWFPRMGDHSRKRFMLGLLRRLHSVDLLQQIVTLLQPLLCKDFTYARSRTNPSLQTDVTTLSADRALITTSVDQYIASTWNWFQGCNYWTKANFALVLLQYCDAHLLSLLGTQARTLLISEEKAASTIIDDDYTEAASVCNTEYSFHTMDHPELDLLTKASSEYRELTVDPFTGKSIRLKLRGIVDNDDSVDESSSTVMSVDPACMVIPTSPKAYAGVSRYRDFIRSLPVHLAKYILSLLDRASLHNAVLVHPYWRTLVEQVHKEFDVNQQLWEEVMLMQGAAAQGANPVFANDIDILVPNLYPGTREVIRTDDAVIKTTFKSEVNFDTAYSGVQTRKVIMEERNVYCGAYNVMVLCDQEDPHRVVHTDGGNLIAIGSKDRKVRFIDSESGKERGPVITGHAGSVRCVFICEQRGIVLSGSYDTSIRCWNIETGQCLKIFRGHRDTVLTILVVGEFLASGSKDCSCKIWDMQTGKCMRSFRHKHPVMAVAMSEEFCITGCDGGRVKVWDLNTGELIKQLNGHHSPVTCIRFDRWHIITGSKDGYALVWSTQGNHNRCLNALRHPKEVLCLEFTYLRVITGSADGRLRIWNMATGQCCRIMRGNSRSDPIHCIIAIGDRITVNTYVNLLVLNFEKVDWDYSLENDKVPPLVQYGSYSDAPVRQQPYPYIRAQRMRKAGATNLKIVNPEKSVMFSGSNRLIPQGSYRAPQLPHSAKSLSTKSLDSARLIQGSQIWESGYEIGGSYLGTGMKGVDSEGKLSLISGAPKKAASIHSKPPLPKRPGTSKSGPPQMSVMIAEPGELDDLESLRRPPLIQRRVSWGFEKPLLPKTKDITLSETKSLLRSQIRMKVENIVPPDFIYMTVSAIQSSMNIDETSANTELNTKEILAKTDTRLNRPSSSPSRIDPRTKVPVEQLGLDQFRPQADDVETVSEFSDIKSIKSVKKDTSQKAGPVREIFATQCFSTPVKAKPRFSLHSKRIKSTLPRGRVIRPISASVRRKETTDYDDKADRPVTAPTLRRPDTAVSMPSSIAASMPGASPERRKIPEISSASYEANFVPMLMYPADMHEKLAQLKERRHKPETILRSSSAPALGKVSQFNDPMRSHVKFELRTHEQEQKYLEHIEQMYREQKQQEDEAMEKKKKAYWLARIKGKGHSECVEPPVS